MNSQFGLVRVGAAMPPVRVGDVSQNVKGLVRLATAAAAQGCDVLVFPELCLTGYTCADLFQQQPLLQAVAAGLQELLSATAGNSCLLVVGAPVDSFGVPYNAAVICHAGRLLGVVPKSYLPNYKEFYESRWFVPGAEATRSTIRMCGADVPFGVDLLFRAENAPGLLVGVEICEDLWTPVPPSSFQALAGATVLCNLSASNELVGKAGYRRELVRQQAARCLAGYVYSSAGVGESSTDLVFGGHCLIAENGTLLAESARFEREPALTVADIDLQFLDHERRQNQTFGASVARLLAGPAAPRFHSIGFTVREKARPTPARRCVEPHPFVPGSPAEREARCQEIFAIQSSGLATRLTHCGARHAVIGLSGGLDSTLALLVTVEAFNRRGLPRAGIHAMTLPGFGTSARTLANVRKLCRHLGLKLTTVDIRKSCRQHFRDLGHDSATGDIAFENAQARERTQLLMDTANMVGGLVIGTGDLSELALGWCTYNGDHMSMYGVNAGVPKTLVRYLVAWAAEHKERQKVAAVLEDILATPISPELLPPDAAGEIAQKTESVIGPYELHDFFLYETVRRGSAPDKVLWLAAQAFGKCYRKAEIRRWLKVFVTRFFAQQFKRSCLPDGPKVGSICLSPRGDWRMPSDGSAADWLARL